MADQKKEEVPESVPELLTRRVLTRKQVEKITGLSCSSIYRLMAAGEFPQNIRLGQRSVRWKREDLEDFLADRPNGGPETNSAARA